MPHNRTEIRAAREGEEEEILHLLCASFGLSPNAARPVFYQDPYFDLSHKRVLAVPGRGIVSCLTVVPMHMRIGKAVAAVGGIAGLATHPDYRRQGFAAKLLSETLPALSGELSYPLTALLPRTPSYYRKLGWETATRVVRWAARPDDLPAYDEARFVGKIDKWTGDAPRSLRELHAEQTLDRTGACLRDDRRWRIIEAFAPARQTAVCRISGYVSGYLFHDVTDDPASGGRLLRIHEMHARDEASRRALVGYVKGVEGVTRILWDSSISDLARFRLLSVSETGDDDPVRISHVSPEMTVLAGIMMRIANLRGALESVAAPNRDAALASGALTVGMADSVRGTTEWIRLDESGVCRGSDTDAAVISGDAGVITRILAGDLTPSDAHSLKRLDASGSEALALADRLFPARDPYVSPCDEF